MRMDLIKPKKGQVFVDAASAKDSCFNEVEDYVKSHRLRLEQDENYLMIYTGFKFLGDK